MRSYRTWILAVFTVIASAGLIAITLGTANEQIAALIEKLDQKNRQLEKANKRLQTEIWEREILFQEKTELQTRLQRSQKMELVATVAGGVAHDLNNVLAGAVCYPDLLCRQIPADSPLRDNLEKIKKSGLKAAAIVSDLLTLVRRGIITQKITNLNLLVSEYLNSPEYEKLKSYHPKVAVTTSLDQSLLNLSASPVHILKAIMNLVSNGMEAIDGKGTLTITTRNHNVRDAFVGYDRMIAPGEYVILEVADTGSGMSPQEMEKVFEPFYSKKVLGKSGTGLGMTVVWGAVKDHEGHIQIDSNAGSGTTFRLYFPASREAMAVTGADMTFEDFKGRGEKILVVDDIPEQREVALDLLQTLGYEATALPNGEAALQYLRKTPVDLVLLDMIMDPGMDGLDTYKEIIKLYPSQKAVIATGYCETERVKEVQELSAGNCLIKPFTLEKLGKTVKSELQFKKAS